MAGRGAPGAARDQLRRVHTTAERRARWGGDAVHPGFVRLSVGIEDPGDLQEDILQALRCILVAYVSPTGGYTDGRAAVATSRVRGDP